MSYNDLEVVNLTSCVEGKCVVESVSFSLKAGEMIAVVGPNGSGKSSFFQALIGLLPVTYDKLTMVGSDFSQLSTADRAKKVSYLPAHSEMNFAFLVRQVVTMSEGFHLSTLSSHELNEVLVYFNLKSILDKPIQQLSAGQQQLVHFVRSWYQGAQVMLFDEPTANLDLGYEVRLMEHLKRTCALGRSAMVVLHNLNTAIAFCDRLLLVDSGRFTMFDDVESILDENFLTQLYQHPMAIERSQSTGQWLILPKRTHL